MPLSGIWWFTVLSKAEDNLYLVSTDIPETLKVPLSVRTVAAAEADNLVTVICAEDQKVSRIFRH